VVKNFTHLDYNFKNQIGYFIRLITLTGCGDEIKKDIALLSILN